MKKVLIPVAAVLLLGGFSPSAPAVVVNLTHLNSTFTVDSDVNPTEWTVDGVYQMYQQGFWWRTNGLGPENRLGSVGAGNITATPFLGTRGVLMDYVNPGVFDISVAYILTGGALGTNTSDVAETISIGNLASHPLEMHFFQYADFDLDGTPADDALWFPNANTVRQVDLPPWDHGPQVGLSETIVSPPPNRHEGDPYPVLIGKLDDLFTDNLNNLPGIGDGGLVGDATWGFQWDVMIPVNGTFLISKDKRLAPVPEPGTALLVGLGLLGAEITRRRKRRV